MTHLSVFGLAARQADWLTQRQATIASNIVNANTPGYTARDVKAPPPPSDFANIEMARTNPAHLSVAGSAGGVTPTKYSSYQPQSWETSVSGNSVSLEQQMTIQSEVGRSMALNTSIVRAFQRMMVENVKV